MEGNLPRLTRTAISAQEMLGMTGGVEKNPGPSCNHQSNIRTAKKNENVLSTRATVGSLKRSGKGECGASSLIGCTEEEEDKPPDKPPDM